MRGHSEPGRQELWNQGTPKHVFCGKETAAHACVSYATQPSHRRPGSVSSSTKWVNHGLGRWSKRVMPATRCVNCKGRGASAASLVARLQDTWVSVASPCACPPSLC